MSGATIHFASASRRCDSGASAASPDQAVAVKLTAEELLKDPKLRQRQLKPKYDGKLVELSANVLSHEPDTAITLWGSEDGSAAASVAARSGVISRGDSANTKPTASAPAATAASSASALVMPQIFTNIADRPPRRARQR